MRSTMTISVFLSGMMMFFACGNNTGKKEAIQHDTIKSEAPASAVAQDSIIQNGEYIRHYESGVIKMRGMMKNGKREGLWKSWYANGSPWSETTFQGGLKNGRTTTWYENEKKRYDGFYTNDIESGKWTFWDEQGNVVKEVEYTK
jgi:antitoxin component YwqK of YwqJK toxin-antitoxin module